MQSTASSADAAPLEDRSVGSRIAEMCRVPGGAGRNGGALIAGAGRAAVGGLPDSVVDRLPRLRINVNFGLTNRRIMPKRQFQIDIFTINNQNVNNRKKIVGGRRPERTSRPVAGSLGSPATLHWTRPWPSCAAGSPCPAGADFPVCVGAPQPCVAFPKRIRSWGTSPPTAMRSAVADRPFPLAGRVVAQKITSPIRGREWFQHRQRGDHAIRGRIQGRTKRLPAPRPRPHSPGAHRPHRNRT